MKKRIISIVLSVILCFSLSIPSIAGGWYLKDGLGWMYQNDDGSFVKDGWQLIDSKWYYFSNGLILANATTPDGYKTDANGVWIDEGTSTKSTNSTNYTNSKKCGTLTQNAFYDAKLTGYFINGYEPSYTTNPESNPIYLSYYDDNKMVIYEYKVSDKPLTLYRDPDRDNSYMSTFSYGLTFRTIEIDAADNTFTYIFGTTDEPDMMISTYVLVQ